jgi:hypothetical protein
MAYGGTALIAFSAMLAACSQANAPIGDSSRVVSGTSIRPLTEEEARQDLADEGYGEVNDLRPQADGSWIGTAMLNGKERRVTITPEGFVFPR